MSIYRNFKKLITEDIYSSEVRDFLRIWRKTGDLEIEPRIRIMRQLIKDMNLKFLGGGSFRVVYELPSGQVIKVVRDNAAHDKSILRMQQVEIERFNRKDIAAFPRLEEYDKEGYLWMIVEQVDPVHMSEEDFAEKYMPKLAELDLTLQYWKRGSVWWGLGIKLLEHVHEVFMVHDDGEVWTADGTRAATRTEKQSEFIETLFGRFSKKADDEDLDTHKRKVDAVYAYLSSPDENFARLVDVVKNAGIPPGDLALRNLGLKDGKVMVIDAGHFGEH